MGNSVQPITGKQNIKQAGDFIKKNHDRAFFLAWLIGISTGFRITDILEMTWSDIDFHSGKVTLNENKGTRARKAKARLKVLDAVKNELIALHTQDAAKMMQVYTAPAKDIYNLIPDSMKQRVNSRIVTAQEAVKPKTRTTRLSPKALTELRHRRSKNGLIDDGFIFNRNTLKSNRAKNTEGVITRQSVWRVMKNVEGFLSSMGESITLGSHSLRKTFARGLYNITKDIALLMQAIGHSSPEMSLRYIGLGQTDQDDAAKKMFQGWE